MESPTEVEATTEGEERKGEPRPLESIWQLLHDPAHQNPRIEAAFKALRDLADSELAAVLKMVLVGTTAARKPNNAARFVALEHLVDALLLSEENLQDDAASRRISRGTPPMKPALRDPVGALRTDGQRAREAAVRTMADVAVGRTSKEEGTVAGMLRRMGAYVWELENLDHLRSMHVTKKAELLIERIDELRGQWARERAPKIDRETVVKILEKPVTLERKTARLAHVAAVVPGRKWNDFNAIFEDARSALKTFPF